MRLTSDAITERVRSMFARVTADAHPDMLGWFDRLGEYNLWQSQLDRLDEIICAGNERAIDGAFRVTELELKSYVRFFNKYVAWLKSTFKDPNGMRVPLSAVPQSLLAEIPDRMLVASLNIPKLPTALKPEPVSEVKPAELSRSMAEFSSDGWGDDIPEFLRPGEEPTLQPKWFTRKR